MIKNLDKDFMTKHPKVEDPWDKFGVPADDYRRSNEDALSELVYPYVLGWCGFNKNGSKRAVLCDKEGDVFWFEMAKKQSNSLRRWADHMTMRMTHGVSYRDAWDVDTWLSDNLSKALRLLAKNTLSFPGEAERELHEKALAVEGKVLELTEEEKKLSSDDLYWKWYHEDLERMAFLFEQWDEEKCAEKNQYEFRLHTVSKPVVTNGVKMWTMDFVGTDEEREETDKHHKRTLEINQYRFDCFQKALKIYSIYLGHLWD